MSVYKYFDKNGYPLEVDFGEKIPKISMIFDSTSVGLFSTLKLIILEEAWVPNSTQVLNNNISNTVIDSNTELINLLTFLSTQKLLNVNVYLNDVNSHILDISSSLDPNNKLEHWDKYGNYLDITFDSIERQWMFEISTEGQRYLDSWNALIEDRKMTEAGYVKKLIQPRDNFTINIQQVKDNEGNIVNTNVGEKTRLFFNWRNDPRSNANFDEIFLFNVTEDYNPYTKINNISEQGLEYLPSIKIWKENEIDHKKNIDHWTNWNQLSNHYYFDNELADSDTFVDNWNRFNIVHDVFKPVRRVLFSDRHKTIPFEINIAMMAENENIFNKTLDIYIIKTKYKTNEDGDVTTELEEVLTPLVSVYFEGEVIDEDERFVTVLENFGQKIDLEDFYVIKDFDLDDDRLDYIKINEKRKELLLVSEDIFPYLGSYKSLYNGLKWLGYQDVTIREYFYNIKTWKEGSYIDYKHYDFNTSTTTNDSFFNKEDLNYSEKIFNDKQLTLGSNDWKKTTRLGLIYQFNKYTGDIDSWGYPVIENKQDFSPEEVLIKLYGLKKVLYKYFLPHNARIINITAEGIYFIKLQLTCWQEVINIFNERRYPRFDIGVIDEKNKLQNIYETFSSVFGNEFQDKGICLFENTKVCDIENMTINSFSSENNVDINTHIKNFIREHFTDFDDLRMFVELFNGAYSSNVTDVCKVAFFLLFANEDDICWNDLPNIPWQFFEPVKFNCNTLQQSQVFNNDETHGNSLASNNFLNLYWFNVRGVDCDETSEEAAPANSYPMIHFTWDTFNIHKNQRVRWNIKHQEIDYQHQIEGLYNDVGTILLPMLFDGKYDVRCDISDDTNTYQTVQKDDMFEVINEDFEIFAFENNVENEHIERESDYIKLGWDDHYLQYGNYLRQDFILPYMKSYNITKRWDDIHPMFVINDSYVANYFNRNIKNWDNLYLVNSHYNKKTYTYKIESINSSLISTQRIDINGNTPVELFNQGIWDTYAVIYNKLTIDNSTDVRFVICPETDEYNLKIYNVEDYKKNSFATGQTIEMTALDAQGQEHVSLFRIEYSHIDYIHNVINIILDQQDKFNFNIINRTPINIEPDLIENLLTWTQLTVRYNKISSRILFISNNANKINWTTSINKNYLQQLNVADREKLFADFVSNPGIEKIPIENVRLDILDPGVYSINVNEDLYCRLSDDYKLVLAPFDWYNANNNIHFSFLHPEYHSDITTGFWIYGWENITTNTNTALKIGDITYDLKIEDIPFVANELELNTLKRNKLLNKLNSIDCGFYFYFHEDRQLIEAVSTSVREIEKISAQVIQILDDVKTTEPVFDNLSDKYFEFKASQDLKTYKSTLNTFAKNNTNIYNKDPFIIQTNTCLFITISNQGVFNTTDWRFEWQLFDNVNNKMLCKSNLHYILYRFDKSSQYSIAVKLINKKSNQVILKELVGWFNVIGNEIKWD